MIRGEKEQLQVSYIKERTQFHGHKLPLARRWMIVAARPKGSLAFIACCNSFFSSSEAVKMSERRCIRGWVI